MQTLNFQCGHCSGLMAVSAEYLGQQVRCPHCQQVVIAPSATSPPPAAPEPAPMLPLDLGRNDDIFGPQGGNEDALFGNSEEPRLDFPSEPAPTQHDEPHLEPTLPHGPGDNGVAAPWQAASLAEAPTETVPHLEQHASPPPESQQAVQQEPSREPAMTVPRKARAAEGGTLFLPLILIPLFLYAAGMTGLAIFLYLRVATKEKSIFEEFPDADGDNPGVRKGGKPVTVIKPAPLGKLPEHLFVGLGKTLRLGDLEVTPLGVERRIVRIFSEGHEKPEPCNGESLVLRLRLKNVGEGYSFTPMDNYFDRWWSGGTNAPLTVLVAGDSKFYGGPAKWSEAGARRSRREWVEGRKNTDPVGLAPGESMETFVCTDGEDKTALARLFGPKAYKGEMVWRVNLRRGLIEFKGRKLPAQCVVGVPFSSKDITGS